MNIIHQLFYGVLYLSIEITWVAIFLCCSDETKKNDCQRRDLNPRQLGLSKVLSSSLGSADFFFTMVEPEQPTTNKVTVG